MSDAIISENCDWFICSENNQDSNNILKSENFEVINNWLEFFK